MIFRFAIAAVGGTVITVGILLMMSDFTARLREQDTLRYFPITDFIPATGVRRPEPPPVPELPPQRPRAQYQRSADRLLTTPPPVVDQPVLRGPSLDTLDPSSVTPDEANAADR